MISSMTGFGRFEKIDEKSKITAELRSVNHKYLDVNIKMPRKFNAFEAQIRNLLKSYATRGKIDIFISYEDLGSSQEKIRYNKELASEYLACYQQIKDDFDIQGDISVTLVAKSPDVLTIEDLPVDENELWEELRPVLEGAFASFRQSRLHEGQSLEEDIRTKLGEMEEHVSFIEDRMPQIITAYKARLKERLADFLENNSIDENRIAAEVTIYADKIAVDEELVRLKTHINHMRDNLKHQGDIGRNLDFLAQEMNREANTILSKSNDIEITDKGIELKTCIEKIREQVQNIE